MTESTLSLMNTSCLIVIDLFCAQNLIAGDDDGSADPYFKFTFQDSVKVSSVKTSTVNPVYVERLIL
jgi:Ca2+-dependent lipid-binding protein